MIAKHLQKSFIYKDKLQTGLRLLSIHLPVASRRPESVREVAFVQGLSGFVASRLCQAPSVDALSTENSAERRPGQIEVVGGDPSAGQNEIGCGTISWGAD